MDLIERSIPSFQIVSRPSDVDYDILDHEIFDLYEEQSMVIGMPL